jgi:hypothetical protein
MFGPNSRLPGLLRSYSKNNTKSIVEFPPITVLAYASATLYLWLQTEGEKWIKTYVQRLIGQIEATDTNEGYYADDDEGDNDPWDQWVSQRCAETTIYMHRPSMKSSLLDTSYKVLHRQADMLRTKRRSRGGVTPLKPHIQK